MVDEREPVTPNQPPRRPRAMLAAAAVLLVIAAGAGVALVVMPAQPVAETPPPAIPTGARLPAMKPIALERMPVEAIDAAAMAAARTVVRAHHAPALAVGLDRDAIAWLRAASEEDAAAPTIPQRLAATDLIAGGAPAGTAAVLRARVDDRAPAGGDDGWQWLLLWLGDDQYAVALAPPSAADLVVGVDARVVGRYVGRCPLPTADGEQSTPMFAARVATPADAPAVAGGVDPLAEFHTARLSLPADIYSEVADERPLVETRPYYYLLGQAKYDSSTPGVYDDALDANRFASRIHRTPDAWRGKPVTVAGRVVQAWRDDQAVTDRPFEVTEVWRVQLASTDSSEITENIDGVDRTAMKLVSRLFEVAIAGPQAPPKPGERIAATGRFLKWRKMPIVVDRERDARNHVVRQSDAIYALFVVAPEWRPAPLIETGPWQTPMRVLWTMLATTLAAGVAVTAIAMRRLRMVGGPPARQRRRPSKRPPTA